MSPFLSEKAVAMFTRLRTGHVLALSLDVGRLSITKAGPPMKCLSRLAEPVGLRPSERNCIYTRQNE